MVKEPEKLSNSAMNTNQTVLRNSLRIQWLMLALGLAILAGVFAYQSLTDHHDITNQEHHRLQTQARVIASNIDWQLESTNLALTSVIKDMASLRRHENMKLINLRLQALTDAMPGVRTMFVLDAEGTIIASNREELIGKDFHNRNYFATPERDNNPSTLYVSQPFKTVLGSFVINISRVITTPNGAFNGVISAALEPEYFKVLLNSVLYAPDMWSAINHGDGIHFMIVPDHDEQPGKNLALPGTFFTRHRDSGRHESVLTGKSVSYTTDRVMALHTIQPQKVKMDKTLYVACSRDYSAIFENWRSNALKQALAFALIGIAAGSGLVLLQRRQRGLALLATRVQQLMRLKLELTEYAEKHDLQDLLRHILDEICRLSNSPVGFYNFVESDQQTLSRQVWSTNTLNEFCTVEKQEGVHYPIEKAGVWAECIRQRRPVVHNDCASLPDRKGLPEGHAPVIRELVVPIFRAGQVVAILGIGNKPADYTDQDIELVTYLADVIWGFTERKRAEEKLNKSEERFRTVAEYTYDWEYWISPEGKILYMTPSCERVTGYTAEEFMNNPALLLVSAHPDDKEKLTGHMECLGKESVPHHADFRIITKKGETRWIGHSCQAVHDSEGNYCGRRASNRDISERKEMEDSLRKSRQLQTDIFDFLPDATFVVDQEKKVIAWNRAMEEMSGVPKEEMLGQGDNAYTIPFYGERRNNLLDLIDVDDDELKTKCKGVTRLGERLYGEAFCPALSNGKGAHVWAVVSPLNDYDGKRIGTIETIRDITAIKEAEANLARSNSELEQFAYVASHDLQEPLRKIAGFTELLANRYKGKLDEKAESYMEYIVDGATRMRSLINDLLKYSRIMRSSRELEDTDCSAVLSGVLRDIELAAKESNAEIVCGPLPTIQADRKQLGQLFQNLIGNAIKYRGAAPPRITITAIRQQGNWLFSVGDNGIGIAPEFYERIFAIFQRLHTRAEYPGTGIGLAICQKIVERHGGKIWVESTAGKGSTFFFTIPLPPHDREVTP